MKRAAIAAVVLCAACIALCAACLAADWLNDAGDVRRSYTQAREQILTPATVKNLKLIWKMQLEDSPTPPVILGHWVTNRGSKELVIVGDRSDNVYAVDADLGRLFWKRRIDTQKSSCGEAMSAGPAFAEAPLAEQEDEDAPQTLRPVYVLAGDGMLHALHPTTGTDVKPPVRFLPPGAKASGLTVDGGIVSATVTAGCSGAREGTWVIDPLAGDARFKNPGVAVQPGRDVHANGVVYRLARGNRNSHATLFALDAATGKTLFSSGDQIASWVESSSLAVANGHVCFGTADHILYCFGFPVDL